VLLEVAVEFFETTGWRAEQHPDEPMLRATFEGEHGAFPCYVIAYEDLDRLAFYAVVPGLVPPDHRDDVALLLSRLNYGLVVGNFELDHDSGEVRFRAGVDVEGGALTVGMVKSMAAAACLSVDFYRGAVESVAAGAITPTDAYDALDA
jgi:hypothetical protein